MSWHERMFRFMCLNQRVPNEQSWARAQEIQLVRPVLHPVKYLHAQIHYTK